MKEILKIWVPVALVVLVVLVAVMRMIAPPPPRAITFAAGAVGGTYHEIAQRYRDRLGEIGVEVTVLETAGTVENYALLLQGKADAALLQGGIAGQAEAESLVSLGGVFAEPFWIFVRTDSPAQSFGDVRALRVAAGGPGSGTRAMSEQLMTLWGGTWAAPEPLAGMAAADALVSGAVDAALFSASVEAAYVDRLLRDPQVRLIAMEQAPALSMRDEALALVILHRGVVDFGTDRPAADLPLVAAIAQLGVRRDLHPAIQSVLLEAAEPIHGGGSLLTAPGAFPDPTRVDLPLSDEARRFYRNGPTVLRRYFPFAVANFLERAWILVIPLLTLLIPLSRLAPPIYRWRIRRRIYVWYNDLHELERRGIEAQDAATRAGVLGEIDSLQEEVGKVRIPASYNDELYRLRSHIGFVESLISRQGTRQA